MVRTSWALMLDNRCDMEASKGLSVDIPPKATLEQHQRFVTWMNSTQAPPFCPICTRKDFDLYRPVVAPMIANDGLPDADHGLPLFPISCNHCGYVLFYNSRQIGM